MAAAGDVVLTPRAARAAKRGRAWFFADDLVTVPPDAGDGALLRVRSDGGGRFGLGLLSSNARIRLRLCGGSSATGDVPSIEAFLQARLDAAIARRAELCAASERPGVRLVHAEADGLPGLVVDRYDDVVVLQISAAGMEAHRDAIVEALQAALDPRAIVARHDLAVRDLEGLPRGVVVLRGEAVDAVRIEEHGVVHTARPLTGHKTGFYLDQRPARGVVRRLAQGRRVLDLFSYQGGFSLAALAGGAAHALAIDQSEEALAAAAASASDGGFAERFETRVGNAFDAVRALREAGETFDLIVLDPPPFAKSRREKVGGARGYRDLNRHALRLLAPGGLLLTCSCSHHVTPSTFEDLLRQAAQGVRFRVILRQRIGAGEDHPAWISMPESEYLKCCLLQRIDIP